jgi:hypothetical protein
MNQCCPKCNHELEVIRACGCQDYFCNHCNELVSKRKAVTKPNSDDTQKKTESKAC